MVLASVILTSESSALFEYLAAEGREVADIVISPEIIKCVIGLIVNT